MSTTRLDALRDALVAAGVGTNVILFPGPPGPALLKSELATHPITDPSDGITGTIPDHLARKLTRTRLTAELLVALDALPLLPADLATVPAGGGLYRDGDAAGYTLVRLY